MFEADDGHVEVRGPRRAMGEGPGLTSGYCKRIDAGLQGAVDPHVL